MRNSNIASTALLYQNRTELEQFIQEYCLPARREDSSWLVMIHTSCHTPEGAVAIAKHVSELLPDAKILGTSASAVIYHGSIYEDGCLLIFTRLLHTQVKVQPLSFADKTPGALAEETAGLLTPDSKAMFAFFTDQYMQMQPYLDRLEETGADIPAAGGMITNNLYGTFAFDENGIVTGEVYKKLLLDKLEVNMGMVMENMVAQMLTASGHKLYFYSNSSRSDASSRMEIDFLIAKSQISNRHNISPIEVKSSKNYTLSSLKKFKTKYAEQLHIPYVLHTGDFKEEDGIVFLPLYMTPLL